MAPLTWRNVEAPNFSPATDGLRTAGYLLNNAFKSAGDGIGDFMQQRQQQADQDVLGRALAYNDPAALQEALGNGTILGNAQGYASAGALKTLGNRASDLLANANVQQTLDKNAYDFGRTQQRNELFDANGPALVEAARLSGSGNLDGAVKHLQANVPGIRGGDALKLIEDFGTQSSAGLGRARTVQDINEKGVLFDRGTQEYKDTQDVDAWFSKLSELGRPELATAALGDVVGKISPRAYNTLIERLRGTYGKELVAPVGTGDTGLALTALPPDQTFPGVGPRAGTAPAAGGNAYDTVYGAGKFGTPDKPVSSMTMGEAVDFGRNTLIPATRGKVGAGPGQGTSAVGAYQFTQSTLSDYGPRVFGENWRNTPMTPENQEKLARTIYDERKNGNLKDTWNNPTVNATPGYYKDKSFDEVRADIVRGETGVDVNRVLNRAVPPVAAAPGQAPAPTAQAPDLPSQKAFSEADVTGLTNRMDAKAASNASEFAGLSDDWRTLASSKQDKNEVLDDLTKKDGVYPAGDRANLDRQIETLMQNGAPSYAVAGEVLKKSKSEDGSAVGNALKSIWDSLPVPGRTSYIGSGRAVRDDVRDSLLKGIKNGRVGDAADKNDVIKANKDLLTQAQADFKTKDAIFQNALRVGSLNPRIAASLEMYQTARNQAAQKLQALMNQIANNRELVPTRDSATEEDKASNKERRGGPDFPYEQMF
jgi:hypothetical protein